MDTTPIAGRNAARLELCVGGVVQGVGFRPFVYRLAREMGLAGSVANTPAGVRICVEGSRPKLGVFMLRLCAEAPPLSAIVALTTEWCEPLGEHGFTIRHSENGGEAAADILPDIATCPDCLREIRDPADRRYRYPFTNCTHCGPRFTIIRRLPYDRPYTSMAGFKMCPACRAEYKDPLDRRFHAQPTACPACGPRLELQDADGRTLALGDEALRATAEALRQGRVAAVKGLGGFHLMTDARDPEAVRRLRDAKRREEKPFALMYPNAASVREDCEVSSLEERLLQSPESPIVLLRRREGAANVAPNVAPHAPRLGVLLPCTPLHHLLMEDLGFPVVATSGNLREEPICIDNREALDRLRGMADIFLVHDRPILRHVDDSIVRVVLDREMVLRRARGFAPLPVRVRESGTSVLAVGAHLKNTVALTKGRSVFISQHIGDLETPEACEAAVKASEALGTLYDARPRRVACDLHPDYLSTKRARALGLPVVAVQHHFAHVLSCMAEHDLEGPVLGVSWDGSGYGPDGTVWGGEFLHATRDGFTRVAHLRPFRLPGGDQAAREPRRSALALVYEALGPEAVLDPRLLDLWGFSEREAILLRSLIEKGVNAPVTTSAGRLFDGIASLLGVRQVSHYEGQAAMALEHLADGWTEDPPIIKLPLNSPAPQGNDDAPVSPLPRRSPDIPVGILSQTPLPTPTESAGNRAPVSPLPPAFGGRGQGEGGQDQPWPLRARARSRNRNRNRSVRPSFAIRNSSPVISSLRLRLRLRARLRARARENVVDLAPPSPCPLPPEAGEEPKPVRGRAASGSGHSEGQAPATLDWAPLIQRICRDTEAGVDPAELAAAFHDALAAAICAVALRAGLQLVVLTGGCFQNVILVESTVRRLRQHGLTPYWHRRVPPNDGGIALGQAVFALRGNNERKDDVPGDPGTDPQY